MEFKLSVNDPIITSYPKYAHLFAIIEDNEKNLLWIAKHFLLFHAYKYETHCSIDLGGFDKDALDDDPYPNGPLIERYKIPYEILNFKGNEINKIIELIGKGFYIILNLNTSNLKVYPYKLEHPILIIGYNTEKSVIYANEFMTPSSKYRTISFSNEDIVKGISDSNHSYLLLYRRKNIQINFDTNILLYKSIVKKSLSNLLTKEFIPYNPYYFKAKKQIGYFCGLDLYKDLKNNLIDYGRKGLHVLFDSKKITYHCLIPLDKRGILADDILKEYEIIVNKAEQARNLYLKYLINKNEFIFRRCIQTLDYIEKNEGILLSRIIKELE